MSDLLQLVTLSPAGRPIVIRDLEDGAAFEMVRDSFQIVAAAKQQMFSESARRYGGKRQTGEAHDNAVIGWQTLVTGGTADASLSNVEGLIADGEVAAGNRFILFRPDGATRLVLFEIRATAEWTWRYQWSMFAGVAASLVEVKVQVAPLARLLPMDVFDDFSVDALVDYTFDSGAASQISVTGGQLTAVSALTTEKRLAHTTRGYQVLDAQDTVKGAPGATISGYKLGVQPRRSATDTYINVYVDDNGTNSRLRIDKVVGGTPTNLASVNLAARVAAGAALWVRGRVEGNVVYAEHFTTAPTPMAAPVTSTSYVLTAAEQAALPAGAGGITWIPQHAAATVDDFEHLPFTYRSLTLPEYIPLGGLIPGTADALADVAVTTYENFVANGEFETNTSGWSVAAVSNVSNTATSITRVTSDAFAGAASAQVVTPGTTTFEGANFALGRTCFAGATYRVRVRAKAVSGTPTIRASLAASATGDGGSSPNTTLSTTAWSTIEGTWTPAANRTDAYMSVTTTTSAQAASFLIDSIEVTGTVGAATWALIGWSERPAAFNLVWNGDFEEDANGWSVAAIAGIVGAGTSIARITTTARFGAAAAQVVCPATAGVGANFPLFRRFRRGVTYTATLWVQAPSSTTQVKIALGVNGDIGAGTPTALTTGWQQLTVTWTPTTDREVAYLAIGIQAATATTFNIDGGCVYEGSSAPSGRQAEGAGALPPIGILEAEGADVGDFAGVGNSPDANARLGWLLTDGTVSGAESYAAGWWIDPSLLVADDFSVGEIDIEFYGRFLVNAANVSPRATLSARPEWGAAFGSTRFTAEFGAAGVGLVKPSAGSVMRPARLGTITLPVDATRPARWKLWLSASVAAGSGGAFGLDYLIAVPVRRRIAGATAKANDSSYPDFIASTAETTRTVMTDLRGLVSRPPFPAQPVGGAMGGPPIELPPGATDLIVKLSSLVPDDPTSDATTEQLSHAGTVHVAVTPRVYVTRGL